MDSLCWKACCMNSLRSHSGLFVTMRIFYNKCGGRFMINIPKSLKIVWESESVLFLINLWTVKISSWNWEHSGSVLGIHHSYLTQGTSRILREWALAWSTYFSCSNSQTKGKDLLTWINFHEKAALYITGALILSECQTSELHLLFTFNLFFCCLITNFSFGSLQSKMY